MNTSKAVTPRPAASILLIRDGHNGLEVLMTERAKTMKFAPGAFVFPGGKVDKQDENLNEYTTEVTPAADTSFKIAVLRELYEEANIFYTAGDTDVDVSDIDLVSALKLHNEKLATDKLVEFAHWVTPEPMPLRFDTYFYIAPHNGQTAKHDDNEAVSLCWVSPHDLLEDWDNDKVPLMFPTRLNLIKLSRAKTVEEALNQAKNTPVVRTLPTIQVSSSGLSLTISEECGYGITKATPKELSVETTK